MNRFGLLIMFFLSSTSTLQLSRIKDTKLKAWFLQTIEVYAKSNCVDIKWRQSYALLQRPGGLRIGVGGSQDRGVLSHETKWS
jgi:hypothetical protein